MEAIGLSLSAVALATLFNTCIECFETFSHAKYLQRDYAYLLIRLDFEKTQLLLWGNASGILKVQDGDRHARLRDANTNKLIEDALKAIGTLLTDANDLRERYGLKSAAEPALKRQNSSLDVLSASSMSSFRRSWTQFCVQAARILPERNGASITAKTRWAVHDKAKFIELLRNLSALVENLHRLIPISDSQYAEIELDMAAVLDLSKLELVETALHSSSSAKGRALSKAASAIISESQLGTSDRRTIAEWLQDTQPTDPPSQTANPSIEVTGSTRDSSIEQAFSFLMSNHNRSLYVVNTPECRNTTCSAMAAADRHAQTAVESFHLETSSLLAKFFPRLRKADRFQPYAYTELLEHLAQGSYEAQEILVERLNELTPFGRILIHTSPCLRAFKLAMDIAGALNSTKLKASAEGTTRTVWPYLDSLWLDRRLYHLESDDATNEPSVEGILEPDDDSTVEKIVGTIIVGELDVCTPLLQAKPLPWTARFPRECEIYEVRQDGGNLKRSYIGSFACRTLHKIAVLPNVQVARDSRGIDPSSVKRSASPLTAGRDKRAVALPITPDVEPLPSSSLQSTEALNTQTNFDFNNIFEPWTTEAGRTSRV